MSARPHVDDWKGHFEPQDVLCLLRIGGSVADAARNCFTALETACADNYGASSTLAVGYAFVRGLLVGLGGASIGGFLRLRGLVSLSDIAQGFVICRFGLEIFGLFSEFS